MASQVVQVPASLLLSPHVPASAKLIWMVSRLPPAQGQVTAGWVCAVSGLSRPTAVKGLACLAAASWGPARPADPGATVPVPGAILTNRKLGIPSRVLYGLLLLTPGFRHPCGQFTHAELAGLAHASPTTVVHGLSELARAEWIKAKRANRLAPIHFELTFPGLDRGLRAIAAAQERLNREEYRGEALMREYLSLISNSNNYVDNTFPGFLRNPRTDELLQFDRFYPPKVAFEFNGAQHYHPTKKYSADDVARQQERDLLKQGLCIREKITLVIIRDEDLTLEAMRRKVGNLLPLRDLTEHDLLIDFLESESEAYRRNVERL